MRTKYFVNDRLYHRLHGAITIYRIECSWQFNVNLVDGYDNSEWVMGRFPPTIYTFGRDTFADQLFDGQLNTWQATQERFESHIIGIVSDETQT